MNPPQATTIACPGDLISTTVKGFREAIDLAVASISSRNQGTSFLLELDLRQARFIDSVGINLLVLTIRRCKEISGSVRICIANQNVHRVLTFMRVNQHAEVILEKGDV